MVLTRRKSLRTLFLLGMISIIIFLSLLHFGELLYFRVQNYKKEISRLNENQLIKQKQLIQREVDSAIEYVRFQNQQMTMQAKQRLQKRVHESHQIASSLYKKYETQKDQLEISALICEALRDIRFNNDRGYFFAFKMNGTVALNPILPSLEGTNLLLSPSQKKQFAKELIALATQKGEGFHQYEWQKPGHGSRLFPKLSYIKYFPQTDWIIGTGEYLDDLYNENKSAAKAWLQSVRFGPDGFLFALDYNSKMIVHAEQKLIGNRMLDSKFPQIRAVFPKMLTMSELDGTFVEYQFRKPKQEIMSRKVSYVARIPEWEWIIGAGFFLDSLESAIKVQSNQLKKNLIMDFIQMSVISILATILAVFLVRIISKSIQQNINFFNEFFSHSTRHSNRMEKSEVTFKEFDQMVEAINVMIKERERIEQDRKKLENQLIQKQKLEALGTLSGGIAHDFNNLLTGIFGNLSLLELKTEKDPLQQKYLNRIKDSANRAKDLVTQILSFSRYSDAKKELVDMRQVTEETLELLHSTFPSTVSIKTELQESRMPILGNKTQLHQIVLNLCNNAFQALPGQTGTINISLTILTGTDHEKLFSRENISGEKIVQLVVRDNGIGIPEKIIGKIFDPFFSTKEKGKGTGLGLSIVHRIISQYGGILEVKSEPEVGTIFHVFLPLEPNQLEETSKYDSMEISKGKGTLLFVDDDQAILESASEFLEHIGYTVVAISSATQALKYLINNRDTIKAMITDQTMPGMTGLELIQKTRETVPDLPIILCTGFSEQVSEETIKDMNLAGFLLKPVSLPEISNILRDCI